MMTGGYDFVESVICRSRDLRAKELLPWHFQTRELLLSTEGDGSAVLSSSAHRCIYRTSLRISIKREKMGEYGSLLILLITTW